MKNKLERKIVAYGRVRIFGQDDFVSEVNLQLNQLLKENIDQVFFDIDLGNDLSQPHFNQMIEAVQSSAIHTIVVTKVDRLFRTQAQYWKLRNTLQSFNTKLYSISQGSIDFSNDKAMEVLKRFLN